MADSFKPDAPVDSFKPDVEQKTLGGFLSNAVSSAGKFASDVAAPILHPQRTVEGLTGLAQGMAEKSGFPAANGVSHQGNVDALVNHYKERYGSWDGFTHALYTDPVGVSADVATLASGAGLAGKGVQVAADAAKLGKVAEAGGAVARAGDAVSSVTDPLRVATKAAGPVLNAVDKAAPAVSDALRRSALKGGYNTNADTAHLGASVTDAAATMGKEKIPLSAAGSAKITAALNDLQQAKLGKTNAGAAGGLAVDPARVQLPLDDVRAKYANQVNPTADLKQIDKVADTFRQNNPGPIPLDRAEALKEGTYKVNNYGPPAAKNMVATADAEKALASGLREELEYHLPELKGLNEQQAKLMNLQGILDKAVTKYTNSGGFLGSIKGSLNTGASKTIGMISGGALASGHAAVGAAGGAADLMMAVLSDPVVKSRLATAIDLANRASPTKWGTPRIAAGMARVEQFATGLSRTEDSTMPQGGGRVIDAATARQFYDAAGRDPEKARALAAQSGWKAQ